MEQLDTGYLLLAAFLLLCVGAGVYGIYWYYTKKQWDTVIANSRYYHNIQRLNKATDYYDPIGNNGTVNHVLAVSSKAKFDKTTPKDALYDYIEKHLDVVEILLERVASNRQRYNTYIKAFTSFQSEISYEDCEKLRIKYEKFREIEDKLVIASRLEIIRELQICSAVEYTSPQGRNHYSKACTYLESEIRVAIKDIQQKQEILSSEEFRRKRERGKVSPKIRLAVLQRDKFRCKYCGRAAADGVELEVDHIIPISQNGTTVMSNLQTLCWECNRGKGSQIM